MLRIYDLAAILAAPRNISFKLRSKLSLQQLGPNLYRKWTFQTASQIYILLVQIMIQPAWMLKWWRRSDREATGFVQLYKGGLTGETRRGNVMYLDFLSFYCLIKKNQKLTTATGTTPLPPSLPGEPPWAMMKMKMKLSRREKLWPN